MLLEHPDLEPALATRSGKIGTYHQLVQVSRTGFTNHNYDKEFISRIGIRAASIGMYVIVPRDASGKR